MSITPKIQLLDLTPVCLQNTNNIMNTFLFMCLDQGHDFRDKSSRTLTGGIRGWVDIDYRGSGYLNKIKENDLKEYIPNEGENYIESDKIFGKHQFVTGLINTSFKGGNGTYGLALVDDEHYKIISQQSPPDDVVVSNFIAEKIKEQVEQQIINFYFETNDENYYIMSTGDDIGSQGITISNTIDNNETSFMFLPLYKRAYNKGMHKLWDFNTKKHIFVVKLDKMYISRTNTPLNFSIDSVKTEISCKKLTVIDLIIPTYTITNFEKSFLNNLAAYLKTNSDINSANLGASKFDKLFDNLTEEQKEVIVNYFLKLLFQGGDNTSASSNNVSTSDSEIQYNIDETGVGYFTLKNYDINLYKCVPRGAKYWFDKNHTSAFKHFVKLLYAHQKPFIHPTYNISNAIGNLENSKQVILSTLLNPSSDNLEKYIAYKNKSEKFDERSPFILKQFGVIPDTTIGTDKNGKNTTINHLINSLNDVSNNTGCESETMDMTGGGLGDFPELANIQGLSNYIRLIERATIFNQAIKPSIKTIYKNIKDNEEDKLAFKDYLKYKFVDEDTEIDDFFNNLDDKDSKKTKGDAMNIDKTVTFTPSTDVTTIADESKTADDTLLPEQYMPISKSYFDNISNVNRDFNLSLSAEKIKNKPFIEIESNDPNNNITLYENIYANNLQQYYDFIPQNSNSSIKSNYFKNCWQTIDFFEENPPSSVQKGGEANYPYRFTVTSAQIDGSLQGGQSIPQYHPPEVDIYMPIFELEGEGKLKGIIVRMVFVKEILANAINSKSRAVIFCHFAYVDFESTGIDSPDDVRNYSDALKKLLEYTINYTYYVKNNTNEDCIDLEALNKIEDINSDDQIDFKIKLTTGERNWYKYYTYTSGPGVKEHFVPPTNYATIVDILYFSKDIANKIASVGDKLIKNSRKLRNAFGVQETSLNVTEIDNHPGAVLFVKLFLVRNKYTGDKSRATDTLFLNQTKYLEGIQISNDENTLYNANMFGQNIIWSTTSKTVFSMAPYLTKENKMPITGGFYINALCESLKGNPSIKIESIQTEESVSDDALVRMDYKTSIVSKLSDSYKNCELDKNNLYNNFEYTLIDALIAYNKFQEKFNDFTKYYNSYDTNLDKIVTSMETIINNQNNSSGSKIIADWREGNGFIRQGTIEYDESGVGSSIIVTSGKALQTLKEANVKINECLKALLDFASKAKKECKELSNDDLNNLILYIIQNIPWWNIEEYKNIIIDRYCYMCSAFLCKSVNKCKSNNCVQKVVNFFKERKNDMIRYVSADLDIQRKVSNCLLNFNFDDKNIPTKITTTDLRTCPPKKPDETGKLKLEVSNNSNKDEIFQNEEKLNKLSLNITSILDNPPELKIFQENISTKINEMIGLKSKFSFAIRPTAKVGRTDTSIRKRDADYEIEDERESKRSKIGKTSLKRERDTTEEGVSARGFDEENNTIKRKQRRMLGGMNNVIDANVLNKFYENSYKCNVGNYLKSFVTIIKSINLDSNINKNDTIKDIIIKILLKYVNLINSSYIPVLTVDKIIEVINNVNNDNNYTVERMNTIRNLYSSQFETYLLIKTVMDSNLKIEIDEKVSTNERKYLIDLINEHISENTFNDLKLSFTKSALFDAILTNNSTSLFSEAFNKDIETTSDVNEVVDSQLGKRTRDAENNSSENVILQHKTNEPINQLLPLNLDINKQYDKVDNKTRLPSYNPMPLDFANTTSIATAAGGSSLKNKRKQINKTRNHKRKNKKSTQKKRKTKGIKYTRRQ